MNLKTLSLIISTLANLGIGTYVLAKGVRKTVNRFLALFIYNLAIWSLFNVLVSISRDAEWVKIFGHWCFAAGILIPITFLCFAIVFPSPPPEGRKLNYGIPALNYALIITGGLLFFLAFTNLIQKQIYLQDGIFRPQVGLLYPLFAFYEMSGMALGLSYLFKKWRTIKTGIEAIQLKILFTGVLIGACLAIITDVILPALGFPKLVSIGPVLTVIIVGFIAYSIGKYHLFDITVVVKKTAIYALLTSFVTAVYIISVLLAERFFREVVGYHTFFPAVFAALIVAYLFLPLRGKIQNFVDITFYRKKYEYQKILRETGKELARVLSLPQLLKMILKNITESVGIEKASLWLEKGDLYSVGSEIGLTAAQKGPTLSKKSDLVSWLRKRDIIIREELKRLRSTEKIRKMNETLKRMNAEIAIPILRGENLTGIICLGNKQSGNIFSREDIELFLTLANQISVTIDNAKLYTQMEEAKTYQEDILRNLGGGVITINREGEIVIFNQRAQELTGFPAEIVGKSFKQIAKGLLRRLIEDTLEKGEDYRNQEIDYLREKNVSVPLAVNTSPLKDSTGKVSGVIIVLIDLSEIKGLEQELYQAEKLASIGRLAAGMAHEIKNPLVAINTFLQLLPHKFNDEEFRAKFSQIATQEVKRINEILEQLLNLAQPKPVNYQAVNIHEVIDGTLTFLDSKLKDKSIKVIKRYSKAMREIYADKDRLKQVFLNLFLNGIESMDKEGNFTISTSYNSQRLIPGEREATVEIKDTGEEIPAEILPRIFDPFFSTKEAGTGLGLAVVQRIIADHGGTIKVKNINRGKRGACFSLRLPAHKEKMQKNLLQTTAEN